MKKFSALCLLILAIISLSGCASTAVNESNAPLAPNQARVTGHLATFTNGVTILMRPISPTPSYSWSREIIIPAGPNRVGIRYETLMTGGLQQVITDLKAEEIEFVAEAGHEYFAQMSGITIFTMGYRITDLTTGQVVLDTKPSKQRPSEAKP